MKIHEFMVKVQQIAKTGLLYSSDPYAIENYENLQELSCEMLNETYENLKVEKNIFENNIYPTPSSSVRVLVVNDQNEVLMVKEKEDDRWALPGGWCEIFQDLKENALREVLEESGVQIEVNRLLAIFRRELYKDYTSICSEYVHYFLATPLSNELICNHETSDVAYFKVDALPSLSLKNTAAELKRVFDVHFKELDVYVD